LRLGLALSHTEPAIDRIGVQPEQLRQPERRDGEALDRGLGAF
jgi:hypothetical protein